jgi:lysophospholipid hydrolase
MTAFQDPAPVIALRKMRDQVQVRLQTQLDRVQTSLDKYRVPVHLAHRLRRNKQPNPGAPNGSDADFARLARWLCGKSIGVVLGGGGARGISHVGALRALRDRDIPIDMVGGTSIGAFIGGLYAREADMLTTHARAKRFSGRLSTLWRLLTGRSTSF